jgi:hypothetical protein
MHIAGVELEKKHGPGLFGFTGPVEFKMIVLLQP